VGCDWREGVNDWSNCGDYSEYSDHSERGYNCKLLSDPVFKSGRGIN
jgi:hypothetical protein